MRANMRCCLVPHYERAVMQNDAQILEVHHARRRLRLNQLQESHPNEPALVLEAAAFYQVWHDMDAATAVEKARWEYDAFNAGRTEDDERSPG